MPGWYGMYGVPRTQGIKICLSFLANFVLFQMYCRKNIGTG